MKTWGYDWEAVKVTTEDDYILNTFHILGKTGQPRPESLKASVLVQHGASVDAHSFIEYTGDKKSFVLALADEGYDMWIGNNRGTATSQGHKTLNAATDNAYWDFSWAEMGLYDDVANIKMIKDKADVDKVFYIGYSQGTAQMFYSLAKNDSFYKDSLYKAVMLAPCMMPNNSNKAEVDRMAEIIFTLPSKAGTYAIAGPNYARDIKNICKAYSKETCDQFTELG